MPSSGSVRGHGPDGPRRRTPVQKLNMMGGPIVVGESVRAAWRGSAYKGLMYEGQVVGIKDDGTFSIAFADGDVDFDCPAKFVTRDNGAPVPRPGNMNRSLTWFVSQCKCFFICFNAVVATCFAMLCCLICDALLCTFAVYVHARTYSRSVHVLLPMFTF